MNTTYSNSNSNDDNTGGTTQQEALFLGLAVGLALSVVLGNIVLLAVGVALAWAYGAFGSGDGQDGDDTASAIGDGPTR